MFVKFIGLNGTWPVLNDKDKGGLDVGSLLAFNKALLYKWRWRFLTEEGGLWRNLLINCYGIYAGLHHEGYCGRLSRPSGVEYSMAGGDSQWSASRTIRASPFAIVDGECAIGRRCMAMGIIHGWDILGGRGVLVDDIMCPVCTAVPEQAHHLFFGCSVAMELWDKLRRWCQLQILIFRSLEEAWEWIDVQPGNNSRKVVLEVLLGSILWIIWTYRNATLFGDGSYRRDMLFDNLTKFSFNWYTSRNRKASKNWTQWLFNPLMN
ncbi:hypothetical protein LXL04_010176 [Taraxacum kok-saghyz]